MPDERNYRMDDREDVLRFLGESMDTAREAGETEITWHVLPRQETLARFLRTVAARRFGDDVTIILAVDGKGVVA